VGGSVTATGLRGADGTVVVVTGAVTAAHSDSRDGHRGGTDELRDSRDGQREPAVSLRTQFTAVTDLKYNLCIAERYGDADNVRLRPVLNEHMLPDCLPTENTVPAYHRYCEISPNSYMQAIC
jgi:hypothetical protein